MATTNSVDSGIDMPPPYPTDKEVAVPHSDTAKQVFSPTADDSMKKGYTPIQDPEEHIFSPTADPSSDTNKEAIPSLPPVSMEKEVTAPYSDTDKQLTSTMKDPLSRTASTTLSKTNACHAFRVEKYNSYGLILPQDQKLALRQIDMHTGEDMGAAYVTGEMSWVDVMSVLPPMFELFRTSSEGDPGAVAGGPGEVGFGGSMELVARSIPQGWEGISGVRVEIECLVRNREGVRREKWEMERKGLGRKYKIQRSGELEAGFMWKGTSTSVKELVGSATATEGKKEKVHKGNLKLVAGKDGHGAVLAVWQQARDSNLLGDLIIFNEARGKIATEVVVVTCLTAVSAERASGMNWFGGLGK